MLDCARIAPPKLAWPHILLCVNFLVSFQLQSNFSSDQRRRNKWRKDKACLCACEMELQKCFTTFILSVFAVCVQMSERAVWTWMEWAICSALQPLPKVCSVAARIHLAHFISTNTNFLTSTKILFDKHLRMEIWAKKSYNHLAICINIPPNAAVST